jgi:hypothetical protein
VRSSVTPSRFDHKGMMPPEEASRTPQGLLTESLTESPRVEVPGSSTSMMRA